MFMTSAFTTLLNLVMDIFFFVYTVILVLCFPILLSVLWQMAKKRFKGEHLPVFYGEHPKRSNFVKALLVEFPRQFVKDLYNRNPNALNLYGVHIWCGEQGSGKSVGIVEWLMYLKKRYPYVKIRSNIDLSFQDGAIKSWKDLILCNNGENGQIEFLDEIQNWFSSNESKNFPVEMLQEITQQRKQRKIVVGSVQAFQRTAKPIREQTTYLYYPFTVAGCLTVVRVYKPKLDSEGNVKKLNRRKIYFFVQNDEIRSAYDTYKKVERLSVCGFQPRSEQLQNDNFKSPTIVVKDKKGGK